MILDPMPAFVILFALSALALRAGAVSMTGALAGLLIGMITTLLPSPAAFVAFLLFVILGSVSTRMGAARKAALGVAQERGGRRSWAHALANAGPSSMIVLVGRFTVWPGDAAVEIAACGGFAAVLADTCASEWGQWLGGRPRSILGLKEVPIGSDGGVTFVGLAATLLAAFLAALLAWPFLGAAALLPITLAGVAGSLVDSLLGATLEPRFGRHGGFYVNAVAATTGIAVALIIGLG